MKNLNVIRMIMATGLIGTGKMSNPQPIGERVTLAEKKGHLKEFKVLPGHKIFSHNTETGETEVERFEEHHGHIYITGRPPFIYCSSINLANAQLKFKKIMEENGI